MFCDQCGGQLQLGQKHCSRCGKAVTGVQAVHTRVREHVRLLGILWLAYSALHAIGAAVVMVVGHMFLSGLIRVPNGPPQEWLYLLHPIVIFVGGLLMAKAVVGFTAGFGLLYRQEWARVLALVAGFLALINVPVGTVLGIYTLWVLLPSQSDNEYKALAAAA